MLLRRAEMKDLPQIKQIILDGKAHLAAQNINQWRGQYPNMDVLVHDINNGYNYVLVEDDEVLGTISAISGPDMSYQTLDGQWMTEEGEYVALHRVAVSANHRGEGLSTKLFNAVLDELSLNPMIKGVRIDTHQENFGMQHVIKKMGFAETGLVKVLNSSNVEQVYNIGYEKLNLPVSLPMAN
ncbi:GNAT family N-acetyltransferase [Companilactobacillus baiquanensis]|uniref:GNAT family N-acetyltransferase n=1 Tax=Companilactobacillus baiquanensis TaxID=2486005 RepID=A0ABW1UVL9_9LACO|nr:GNAT family N-acetyltransferase [Companilactobacillus baiquanensis]